MGITLSTNNINLQSILNALDNWGENNIINTNVIIYDNSININTPQLVYRIESSITNRTRNKRSISLNDIDVRYIPYYRRNTEYPYNTEISNNDNIFSNLTLLNNYIINNTQISMEDISGCFILYSDYYPLL